MVKTFNLLTKNKGHWKKLQIGCANKTGARGYAPYVENIMMDLMYELPSKKNIVECIVNEDTILNNKEPILIYENP